jgi:hypothetical protein
LPRIETIEVDKAGDGEQLQPEEDIISGLTAQDKSESVSFF